MKIPCCSVCQNRYNEEERVPLLLQCGHGFCKECLSKMFSSSSDTSLSCPRCRHITLVGNSVTALRKNFAVLSLISSTNGFDCDITDDDDEDEDDDGRSNLDEEEEEDYFGTRRRSSSRGAHCGGGGGTIIDLGSHNDLRLIRRLGGGEERRNGGVEMWSGVLSGVRRCRHKVAVKRVTLGNATDLVFVQSQLENLRRSSMWCRNVSTFHGATTKDGKLCLIMDRYSTSVQEQMRRNEGRLTLEQILRYFCISPLLNLIKVSAFHVKLWNLCTLFVKFVQNLVVVRICYKKLEI